MLLVISKLLLPFSKYCNHYYVGFYERKRVVDSFDELYQNYNKDIFRFLYKLCGYDRVLQKIDAGNFSACLFRHYKFQSAVQCENLADANREK